MVIIDKFLDKFYQMANKRFLHRISNYFKDGGDISMASEVLKLTADIVISHASMSELSTRQLVEEIKDIYNVLSALEFGVAPETLAAEWAPEGVKKPPIPLKDIVTQKYVVCLECGKKMRTLKAHIRKAHGLMPKEYFKRFGLDRKKYPLVAKEYSEQRRKIAVDRGLGQGIRKATV
jgi:predicted transcriptional regulator